MFQVLPLQRERSWETAPLTFHVPTVVLRPGLTVRGQGVTLERRPCRESRVAVGDGGIGGEDPGRETLIVRVTSSARLIIVSLLEAIRYHSGRKSAVY